MENLIDLEKRIAALESWRKRVESHIDMSMPLGPINREPSPEEARERGEALAAIVKKAADNLRKNAAPVDRNAQELTSGKAVPKDRSHATLKPNGQQKDYVVLTAEERAKGFVRPVRRSYVHTVCGGDTRMSQDIAETYARDPKFYNGTFCCACGKHFPLDQFVWKDNPDQKVGS